MSKKDIFADVTGLKEYQVPEVYEGFWVRLRKELSVGERRAAYGGAVIGQTDLGNGKVRTEYDHTKLSFALVTAYLAEWSDDSPISPSAIQALKPDVYAAIEAVVDKHVKEMEAERPTSPAATTKANRATRTSDAQTSRSAA